MICLDSLISIETLAVSPIEHHAYCQPHENRGEENVHQKLTQIVGVPDELPLLSDCLDLIIAPHILEFSEDPKAIVKELWRVLLPEGRAIFIGFNSTALFGLSHVLKNKNHPKHLLPCHRLRKLFIAQGFVIEFFKTFFFRPTFLSEKRLAYTRFMEILGDICWPHMGAIYLYVARKPVLSLTPLRKKIKRERLIMPKGIVEPVARNIHGGRTYE